MFFRYIVLLFILTEFFVLFVVADEIGFLKTFCLCLLSAFTGVLIIQRQGIEMLMRAQGLFNKGGVRVDNMFGSLFLIVAGLLFLMPGFVSDVIGFCLLIPYVRRFLQGKMAPVKQAHTPQPPYDEDIIDGSYVRVENTVDAIEQKNDRP